MQALPAAARTKRSERTRRDPQSGIDTRRLEMESDTCTDAARVYRRQIERAGRPLAAGDTFPTLRAIMLREWSRRI